MISYVESFFSLIFSIQLNLNLRCDALKFELTRSKRKLLNKMNKFLQAQSIEQVVMCNKSKKSADQPADEPMDYGPKSTKVDFNLNNITDSTDNTMLSNSPGSTKHCPAKTQASQPAVNKHQQLPKTIDIEQLRASTKRKAARILRRIEKIKKKLNCTEQYAIDLLSDRKKQRIARNAASRLSLEDYLSKEKGLKNELKVSALEIVDRNRF